ncbi:HAD family acid phosphatase [Kribbella deserti]|uniref:HAD family acid phosphatase n=1 Tax=Kribbella deserti TaxID=1926257 RepID=A0ABV6QL46_9ACTN
MPESDEKPFAVLDIDATLSDTRHRLHFIKQRPKDWDGFFAAGKNDEVLPEGHAVATSLARGHDIIYLTGRPERIRKDTLDWLKKNGFPPGRLLMRGNVDRRPSVVMKLEKLARLAAERKIAVLVDDDVAVVRGAEKAGYTVLHADWALDEEVQPTLFEAQETEGRT